MSNGAAERPTIVICEDDDVVMTILTRCAADAGFDVIAEAHNAPELLAVVDGRPPDVVMVRHELPGTLGSEAAAELLSRPNAPVIVIASPDPGAAHLARSIGAAGAVDPLDSEAVVEFLVDLVEQVISGERRTGQERRVGADRRIEQDWSKVFSERRSGDDRRATDRRE